jgi:hypothetical protein
METKGMQKNTEKNEYAYPWHDAICEKYENYVQVSIFRTEPFSMVQQPVTFRICKNQDDIYKFLNSECKVRNIKSARKFLEKKPKVFERVFMLSMGGALLSAEFLMECGIVMPHRKSINTILRATAILQLMDRWGLLWQFLPGEWCNLIECI